MTPDKLKALRKAFQREAPSALADLSMSDDEYSGVEEWARSCPACGQRDDCEHKLLGRALVKIELLNKRIAELEATVQKACDPLNWSLEWENCTKVDIESMVEFINKHDKAVGGKP